MEVADEWDMDSPENPMPAPEKSEEEVVDEWDMGSKEKTK